MNHWRLLRWLFPERARRHTAASRRQELELEVVRRQHDRIQAAVDENTRRLEAIEAEVRLLGRGILR